MWRSGRSARPCRNDRSIRPAIPGQGRDPPEWRSAAPGSEPPPPRKTLFREPSSSAVQEIWVDDLPRLRAKRARTETNEASAWKTSRRIGITRRPPVPTETGLVRHPLSRMLDMVAAVSYTHLTLPTKRI